MKLVLASASPRRAELLRQAGISFRIIKPDIIENLNLKLTAPENVARLAHKKANYVAARLTDGTVLGADTVVVHRGSILGKPADREEARRILRLLCGDVHQVLTGLALIDAGSGQAEKGVSVTSVWMKDLSEKDINTYVNSGEPLDKAGAYGIQGQGALFVEKIEGCYFNVVGLPLSLLFDLMQQAQRAGH